MNKAAIEANSAAMSAVEAGLDALRNDLSARVDALEEKVVKVAAEAANAADGANGELPAAVLAAIEAQIGPLSRQVKIKADQSELARVEAIATQAMTIERPAARYPSASAPSASAPSAASPSLRSPQASRWNAPSTASARPAIASTSASEGGGGGGGGPEGTAVAMALAQLAAESSRLEAVRDVADQMAVKVEQLAVKVEANEVAHAIDSRQLAERCNRLQGLLDDNAIGHTVGIAARQAMRAPLELLALGLCRMAEGDTWGITADPVAMALGGGEQSTGESKFDAAIRAVSSHRAEASGSGGEGMKHLSEMLLSGNLKEKMDASMRHTYANSVGGAPSVAPATAGDGRAPLSWPGSSKPRQAQGTAGTQGAPAQLPGGGSVHEILSPSLPDPV